MSNYEVRLVQSVVKKLSKLPVDIENRIFDSIKTLQYNPRPLSCKKLKGLDGYRIRIGDYRIIYQIKDNFVIIIVLDIGHRRDIYQYFKK